MARITVRFAVTALVSMTSMMLFVAQPVSAQGDREGDRRGTRRADTRVHIGGGVRVETDEVIDGDVVAIGGGVYVDGRVSGDVVAIGGGAELGPNADVSRDVTVVGGPLRRDPSARVGGRVNEVGVSGLDLSVVRPRRWGSAVGSLIGFAATMTRLAVLCILATVVLLLGHEYVQRAAARAAAEPVIAGVVGLLIQLLFFPVLLVSAALMIVTIIGIPLLVLVPFALLALAALFLIGFTSVAYDVGRRAIARFGWTERNAYFTAAIGIVVVLSPLLIGRLVGLIGPWLMPVTLTLVALGVLVEYAAWTVGLGAVALQALRR